jgi:hypothetical protein
VPASVPAFAPASVPAFAPTPVPAFAPAAVPALEHVVKIYKRNPLDVTFVAYYPCG